MTTIYRGVSVPDLTDPPNAPDQFRRLVDTGGAVPRFATLAEANTAYPAGQRPVGMMVAIGTRMYISDGTNFTSVAAGGIENFATAAARSASLPAPAVNTATTLTTDPGIVWVWDGSVWQPAIEGRPIARGIVTGDLGTSTSANLGPVTSFTLAVARCVSVSQASALFRGTNVGLVQITVNVDGSSVDGTGLQSYHAVMGSAGRFVMGATGYVDLAAGTHTAQFHVVSVTGGATAYIGNGSRYVIADAGPNRGLFPA